MPIRRRLARFNRVFANRLIGRAVAATPGFGAVLHRGRRSGREYRTPVMVFRHGERFVFALPYGADADWVKNVLAAGGCELRTRGRRIPMTEPRVYADDERRDVPAPVRRALRWLGAREFLELRVSRPPSSEQEKSEQQKEDT
jgi:deazaflavin-dependent oxidoreductase (nitroreductase family)